MFDDEALSVTVPTIEGLVEVLANHEPIAATVVEGTVTVRTPKGEQTFAVQGGVLEVSNNQATILL